MRSVRFRSSSPPSYIPLDRPVDRRRNDEIMKPVIGIHLIITIFIWLVSLTVAIDMPLEDLNSPYKICDPWFRCSPKNDEQPSLPDLDRGCRCDELCDEYGDCCTDSTYFHNATAEHRNIAHKNESRYMCLPISNNGGVYVTVKCPAEWTDEQVRYGCETPYEYGHDTLQNPVTSRTSGRGYRNWDCAVCNGDVADLVLWDTLIECNTLRFKRVDIDNIRKVMRDTLKYDGAQWTVTYMDKVHVCSKMTLQPPSPEDQPRRCVLYDVATCHPDWSRDSWLQSNCDAYTALVYGVTNHVAYKNIHCALCNHNNTVWDLKCKRINPRILSGWKPLSVLITGTSVKRKCSGDHEFYDPMGKTCRPLASPVHVSAVGRSPRLMATDNNSSAADNWSPHKDTENVTADHGSVAVYKNTSELHWQPAATETFGSVVITYVGLGVSTIFLIVHLAVFTALPEMKNLSGKNLASLCVSLVCAYAAFAADNWLTGPACYAGAAFTYYAFLASFTWMLVMSIDCWHTLRLATVELHTATGRQTKRFLMYSAVCWLTPAALTFTAVAADAVPAVPDRYRPRFGADNTCWFGSKPALLVFFTGPLTAVMAVNITLFVCTAYVIHSGRTAIRNVNPRYVRRDFRMYCRLTVLMGLTWSTGIAAAYADNQFVWILFVVLNAFQGLFVFVAFTCRRKFLDLLMARASGGHSHDHHGKDKKKASDGDDTLPTSVLLSISSSNN